MSTKCGKGEYFDEELGRCVPNPEDPFWIRRPPRCYAGPDQIVKPGTLVTLDGSASKDINNGGQLVFSWSQIAGQTVTLSDPKAVKPTFKAPDSTVEPPVKCPDGQCKDPISQQCRPVAADETIDPVTNLCKKKDQPPPGAVYNEHGTLMLLAVTDVKNNRVPMEKGSNHRNGQRYNVNHKYENHLMQGYYKIASGQKKIETKEDGPNHGSCDFTKDQICFWCEMGIDIATGKADPQYEWPHADNYPMDHDKVEVIDSVGPIADGTWVEWSTACYWGADGFRHYKAWCDPKAFPNNDPTQKPNNNAKLVLHIIHKADLISKPIPITIPRDMKKVINYDKGFECEIRMHKGAQTPDADFKFSYVYEVDISKGDPTVTLPTTDTERLIETTEDSTARPLSADETNLAFRLTVTTVNGISASDDVNIIVKKGIPDPTECQPDQCRDVSTGLCRAIGPNEHKSPTDGSCQPNPVTGGKTTIMAFADGDAVNSNSDKVLEAVFKEPEADCYIAAGDFGYKNKMKEMVARFEKYFKTPQLMDKLFPNEGNHDGPESQNAEQRKIFMDWYGRGLEQKNWLLGRQVGRVYLIGLNTQDTSVEQETGEQRKWAEQEFIVADKLRSEGKIDWIMTVAHKPFFTLKTSHSEYTAVRKIYDPLFRKYKVILMIQGHNHNYQASYPMIVDFSTDANGLGKQLFTYATDGVTFDASKEIGTIYNITGHFGHEWNAINTSGEAVKNFMNFRHSGLFGFTKIVAEIKDGKPHLTVSEISTDSKVNFEYYVTQ